MNASKRNQWLALVLLFTALIAVMPHWGFDDWAWKNWATYIFQHGLGNAYDDPIISYNPLYLYVLWAYGEIQGSPEAIERNIWVLKIFTLLFDFGGAVLIWKLVSQIREYKSSELIPYWFLFNAAFLYNTILWGQIDAIFTTLILLSFYFLYRRKPLAAAIFYILAINTKYQAIIFLPALIIMAIYFLKEVHAGKVLMAIFACIVLQTAILLPFLFGSGFQKLVSTIMHVVDYFPVVSKHAYNFWYLLLPPGEVDFIPDTSPSLFNLSFKTWGFILFISVSLIVLIPSILKTIAGFRQPQSSIDVYTLSSFLLPFGLLPVIFFYFNTQMHERYCHPALLFLGGYSILTGKYFFYIVISIAYYLNMEAVFNHLQLNNYHTLLFDPRLVSLLFLSVILTGIIVAYRDQTFRCAIDDLRRTK